MAAGQQTGLRQEAGCGSSRVGTPAAFPWSLGQQVGPASRPTGPGRGAQPPAEQQARSEPPRCAGTHPRARASSRAARRASARTCAARGPCRPCARTPRSAWCTAGSPARSCGWPPRRPRPAQRRQRAGQPCSAVGTPEKHADHVLAGYVGAHLLGGRLLRSRRRARLAYFPHAHREQACPAPYLERAVHEVAGERSAHGGGVGVHSGAQPRSALRSRCARARQVKPTGRTDAGRCLQTALSASGARRPDARARARLSGAASKAWSSGAEDSCRAVTCEGSARIQS